MSTLILKAKHWIVFIIFAAFYFIDNYLRFDLVIASCVLITAIVFYVGWYIMLGNALYNYLPGKTDYSLTWFLIDGFLIIIAYAAVIILYDGILEVTGFAAIPGFYLLFAIAHLFWFPSVTLVAIELGHEPEFSQYGGTLMQMIFWPIGIWFIQPRLNRIYNTIRANNLS